MPLYKYLCPDNGEQVEVSHPSDVNLVNWGQLCFVGQVEMGETPFEAPIEKVLMPAQIVVPDSNSKLKENGFTKLVKRDEGVYENVTALDDEERLMVAGRPETLPNIPKKIKD